MKVLLLSISLEGGAGGATHRLHQGLKHINVSSQVLVQTKSDDDETVIAAPKTHLAAEFDRWRPKLDRLPLKLHPRREFFSLQWFPDAISSRVTELNPDVINLHWVCNGFVRIETIPKLKKPIVWTLHDVWPFTGGCFHNYDCERYIGSCGACPQLYSSKEGDLSRWVWRRKAKAWQNLNLTLVSPSSWLAERARTSSLFKDRRIEVIPNGLDTKKYKPIDRRLSRKILNLPLNKHIVLFGAWINSHLKGFHLLQPALQNLSRSGWQDKLEVVIFGLSRPSNEPDLGFKSHYLGRLNDDITLALAYSTADVFVVPSLIENLSTTTMEAIACGTPCVAFNVGGMSDLIEHRQNGYLAQPYEIEDLAQGIAWILEDSERYQRLAHNAREKAEREFSLEMQAQRYMALFEEIV